MIYRCKICNEMSLYKNTIENHVMLKHMNSMGGKTLQESYEFIKDPLDTTEPKNTEK